MPEPAYVSIAGKYARKIRSGQLPPGVQLPSLTEISAENGVSKIVARKAIELLQNQGLVRTVQRRGVFVSSRTNLVRVALERQFEDAETTFGHESAEEAHVERDTEEIPAPPEVAEALNVPVGEIVTHVVTRATEERLPISISDTYQPLGITGVSTAKYLEETHADRLPVPEHAQWLKVEPGEIVKTVHQKFTTEDGDVVMISDISYPRDRYDAFVFKMTLR
ncbi:GntR family transcriptional regulator [Amycolatopsis regifaucium]|uniref:GntR family transcriptional regulator n=1 Tax=Amycolatopsis regifaucium TaxID=546365 RepID=A0A154MI25_9PSEU|nr:GntR family transcriptional regulator [Amycolatopsis regifaucium]KZB84071.1 GntR family transcriptional regulator [Amycolatopsis regifaucium]OKA08561.1 GntR family transcriptional regulator [Amycolatopsis regifaucium]